MFYWLKRPTARWYALLALLGWTLLATACGPVYETYHHYLPPNDAQGKRCALECEQQRNECQASCDQNYQQCSREAKLEGKVQFLEARQNYLEQKNRCAEQNTGSGCKNLYEPNQYQYTNTSNCQKDCGCNDNFDRCFQICGGRIERETRCVSDCK